jgi:hypothetical protein
MHEAVGSQSPALKKKEGARCWWLRLIILTTGGGRDWEDQGSKPAQGNSSPDPISKKLFTKKGREGGRERRRRKEEREEGRKE